LTSVEFGASFQALLDNIEYVIHGKTEAVTLALVCLFAEGHLLIEDVPGVGKTSLARCIAASVDVEFGRVQFTPDLLPSDITGVSRYRQKDDEFEFRPGPVFGNIVLADELNRASPRTQSALLECMAEGQVTVDGTTHRLPAPFMVVATQNPADMRGTFALPESQLDRFLMRIRLDYPGQAAEVDILRDHHRGRRIADISAVLSSLDLLAHIEHTRTVHVADAIYDYIVRLVAATRTAVPSGAERPNVGTTGKVQLGVSPRGSVALMRTAQVFAATEGRDFVVPEDVQTLAGPVLAHRVVLSVEAELGGMTGEEFVQDLVGSVPVPRTLGST
jgi:MoxR-like ATPase